MSASGGGAVFHATTVVAVRHHGTVAVGGDGQVTLGQTVVKGAARKVRAGIVAMEGNFGLARWYRRAIERKESALEEHA